MINIIINKLTCPLRRSMAHYKYLHQNPNESQQELVRMDIITTKFQRGDKHRRQDDSKDRGKKRTIENRIHLKGKDKNMKSDDKRDFELQEQIDGRKKASRCIKCSRKNHQGSECEYGYVYKTPPLKYTNNLKQEPVNKKARTDIGHLRITK